MRPGAAVLDDAQRRVGVEAEGLRLLREQRPFGRGGTRPDLDGDGAVQRHWFLGAESQPASFLGPLDQPAYILVRLDLVLLGQAQGQHPPSCAHPDGLQHRGGINALVEGDEEQGVRRLGGIGRVSEGHLGRRGAEGPLDRLAQFPAGYRAGARRHGDPVHGRLGKAVDQVRVIFKGQVFGANPAPPAGQVGFELHRYIGGGQVAQRRQGNHRLVEGQVDERGQRDLPFRAVTEHLQRALLHLLRRRGIGRRGERLEDRLSGARRGDGVLGELKIDLVIRLHGDFRQARQHLLELRFRQRRARHLRQGLSLLRFSPTFAQADEELLFAIHHVRYSSSFDNCLSLSAGRNGVPA